jgi:hypothetical protein
MECRSDSEFAAYGDESVVELNDLLRDGQPQADASERWAVNFE